MFHPPASLRSASSLREDEESGAPTMGDDEGEGRSADLASPAGRLGEDEDGDEGGGGRVLLWAIGGRRNQEGELVVDVGTDFRLPLSGRYQGDAFIVTNHNFVMGVTGIPIPFNTFEIRGRMGQDLHVLPGARAYAETKVLSIPTFGIPMVVAGLANRIWRKLVAMATYITNPYPADGTANKKPPGVGVELISHRAPDRAKPRQRRRQTAARAGPQLPGRRAPGGDPAGRCRHQRRGPARLPQQPATNRRR